MSVSTLPCEFVPAGNFAAMQRVLRDTIQQLAEAKVLIESQQVALTDRINEVAELNVKVRKLYGQLELARSSAERELLADRLEVGRDCVEEVLNWDPEATEGYATFECETNDRVLCAPWTCTDDQGRTWSIELAIEPATKTRAARMAYFCRMV